MATIGDIVINLGLDRRGFTNGIEQASNKLNGFGSMAKSGIGMAGKVVAAGMATAAAATAAAAAVIIPKVTQSLEVIDELAKKADKLGISTENFTALRYAAQQSGQEIEDMDELLKNINEKVGLARFGDTSALEQFEKLNITMKDLEGLDTMESVNLIADRMAALPDHTMRAAAGLELFSEEGYKLAGMLSQGSEELKKTMQEAEGLGATFSRMDAAKVEMVNTSLTKLWTMMDGLWNKLTVAIAPILAHVIDQFVEWGTEGNTAAEWIDWGIELIAKGIGFVGDLIDGVKAYWQGMQAVATKALAWVLSGVNKVAEGLSYLGGLVGMDFDTSFLKDMADELHRMADKDIQDARTKFQGALSGNFTKQILADLDAINKAAGEAATVVAENASKNIENILPDSTALNKLKELKDAAKSVFDATRNPLEKFETEIGKLQELFEQGLINEDTLGRAVEQAKQGVLDSIDVGEIKAKVDITQNAAVQRGSQEAFARTVQAILGPKQDSTQLKSLKVQQEQSKLLSRMTAILEKQGGNGLNLIAANF